MSEPTLEIDGITIVMVGNLNPAIFHPAWFASQQLIEAELADAANVKVLHPDAAVFDTDWFELLVTRDRFQIGTQLPKRYPALRSLAIGTFQALAHTPLWTLGINKDSHYRLADEPSRRAVCDMLAPDQPWSGVLDGSRLRSVVVEADRPDGHAGYLHVKVEPSSEVAHGLHFNINDHYQFDEGYEERPHSAEILDLLASQWEKSLGRARHIAETLLRRAL